MASYSRKMRESFTIMYFKTRGGKVRTLKVGKKILNTIFIGSLSIFFLAGFSTYMMVKLYEKNERLLYAVKAAKKRGKTLAKRLSMMTEGSSRQTVEQKWTEVEEKQRMGKAEVEEKTEVSGNKASVENIRVLKIDENKSTINFDVVKGEKGGDKVSGMVVIVGKVGDKYFTIPDGIEVKGGVPVHHSQGYDFVIRYRKPLERTIPHAVDSIDALDIFVYDAHGEILLQQSVDLP